MACDLFALRVLALLLITTVARAADRSFISPPDDGTELQIPQGTSMTVEWTSPYSSINLRVWQEDDEDHFNSITLLSEVETDPGPGSYAWYAENLVSKRAVHFEVTQASNGQSFNPLNSGFFYITNGTSIQTSTVSSAIGLATTTSGAGQTSTQTTAVAATGTTTPSSAQSQTNTNNSSALSIGLGVGLGVGLSLLIAAAVFIICRKRKRKSYPEDPRPEAQSLNKEAYAAPSELGHSSPYVSEADSSAWPPQKHHLGAQEAPTESARYEMGPR